MPIRSDLSRQQDITQRRIGATGTFQCITIRFVFLAIKLFAMRSDLSRQRCMKRQRSVTGNTCLCILIRFVQLAVSFFRYDLICPNSDFWHIGALKRLARLYALRYYLSYRQSCFCNPI